MIPFGEWGRILSTNDLTPWLLDDDDDDDDGDDDDIDE
jgi:hypothetical protein